MMSLLFSSLFSIILVLSCRSSLFASATNPCDLSAGFSMKSARIEFDEDTVENSLLYNLPFEGTREQIDEITFRSNDLDETKRLSEYFLLNFKSLMLGKHYDLDVIELDLIELLFTCTAKSNASSATYKNTFLLYITINDVNDNAPEFLNTPYKFKIKELTPIGTIVYDKIQAIDKDLPNKPNSQISFSILKGPFSNYFEFPLTTMSEISVVKLIQYEVFSKCYLTIQVQDHGTPQLSTNTTIEIDVIDIDDKDPVFSRNYYTGYILRNSHPGTTVNMTDSIFAQDQDVGINMTLTYTLTSNHGNLFEINELNGEVKLKKQITDYDKMDYNLIVKATQIDNPLRSALSTINIIIVDINNYAPKFDSDSYEANIYENSKMDKIVCILNATDEDKNRIEYSILNNHEVPFSIDKYKGIVRVNGRLDFEMKSKYKLVVFANDGNHTVNTTVQINVINLVDKEPYFEYDVYNFKIKIPYDVYIGQVRAIDVENTGNLNYSLVFDQTNLNYSKLFCITQTGVLYLCTSTSSTNLDDLFGQYKQEKYNFNISVSIYSDSMSSYLESHVECKITIEQKNTLKTSTSKTMQKAQPTLFQNEALLFKDKNSLYIFISIIGGTLILLFICIFATVWLKCRRGKKARNVQRSNKPKNDAGKNKRSKYPLFSIFATTSTNSASSFKKEIRNSSSSSNSNSSTCSPSSRTSQATSNSCKDSTSGFSCLSALTSKSSASNQQQKFNNQNEFKNDKIYYLNSWEEKQGENDLIYETTKSKLRQLTQQQQQQINNQDLNEFDQIKVASYFNILSSTASTLKNRDTPIIMRHNDESSLSKNLMQIQSNKDFIDSLHSTFSKSNSKCCIPKSQSSSSNKKQTLFKETVERLNQLEKEQMAKNISPKLLTFLPPQSMTNVNSTLTNKNHVVHVNPNYKFTESNGSGGILNLVFNRNEPLSLNSEINIENDEKELAVGSHSTNDLRNVRRNNSIRNQNFPNGNNANEIIGMDQCFYEIPNDSSMISISVDNFTNNDEYLEEIEEDELNQPLDDVRLDNNNDVIVEEEEEEEDAENYDQFSPNEPLNKILNNNEKKLVSNYTNYRKDSLTNSQLTNVTTSSFSTSNKSRSPSPQNVSTSMFSNINSQKFNNNARNANENLYSSNSNCKRKLSDLSFSTTYSSLTNESQDAFRRSDNGLLILRANIYHEYDSSYKNNNNNNTESNYYDEATDYSSYV